MKRLPYHQYFSTPPAGIICRCPSGHFRQSPVRSAQSIPPTSPPTPGVNLPSLPPVDRRRANLRSGNFALPLPTIAMVSSVAMTHRIPRPSGAHHTIRQALFSSSDLTAFQYSCNNPSSTVPSALMQRSKGLNSTHRAASQTARQATTVPYRVPSSVTNS